MDRAPGKYDKRGFDILSPLRSWLLGETCLVRRTQVRLPGRSFGPFLLGLYLRHEHWDDVRVRHGRRRVQDLRSRPHRQPHLEVLTGNGKEIRLEHSQWGKWTAQKSQDIYANEWAWQYHHHSLLKGEWVDFQNEQHNLLNRMMQPGKGKKGPDPGANLNVHVFVNILAMISS